MTILQMHAQPFLAIYNIRVTIAVFPRHLLIYMKFRITCQIWQPIDLNIASIEKRLGMHLRTAVRLTHTKNWMSTLHIHFLKWDRVL